MIEYKKIKHPSTQYGMGLFYKELEEAILDGYRIDAPFNKGGAWYGPIHQITLVKETPDDPLDKLDDPKLKKEEIQAFAKEEFGIDVPNSIKTPASMKKYVRGVVKGEIVPDGTPHAEDEGNTEE